MIYVIKSGSNFKVGYSSNVESRLKTYNTHNPTFEVVLTLRGDSGVEKLIHEGLDEYRIDGGEWFRVFDNYETTIKCIHSAVIHYAHQLRCKVSKKKNFEDISHENQEHFSVFPGYWGAFLGLKSCADIKLMAALCAKADFNTGLVRLSTNLRRELCEETEISVTNINKNFKRLVNAGLLAPKNGDYVINPEVFWKGTMKSRTELLKNGGLSFQVTMEGV